ncbi:hypothetical protein HMPREF0262_01926 [Clostridium sp. ATCC 29733]|nr:hypothetical protein HMPREF0262_01926 [Clostridium sp. ATCC 29733]
MSGKSGQCFASSRRSERDACFFVGAGRNIQALPEQGADGQFCVHFAGCRAVHRQWVRERAATIPLSFHFFIDLCGKSYGVW